MNKQQNTKKVPISRRALEQRINRALAHEGEKLLKTNPRARTGGGWPLTHELGDYYTIDMRQNRVTRTHLKLKAYAEELGVLDGWETLTTKEAA
jgi:hypothetical protein